MSQHPPIQDGTGWAFNEPQYWEPWHPKIGDRVRIRLSAECRCRWHEDSDYHGHFAVVDGWTGTISTRQIPPALFRPEAAASHPYVVEYDGGIPSPTSDGILIAGCFAAVELERLEEANP